MIEKRTTLDRIESTQNPVRLQARLLKRVVENDEDIVPAGYHRTAFDSLDDFDAQIGATNNSLALLGFPPITEDDVATLRAHAQLVFA